jgi:hypothetical protein
MKREDDDDNRNPLQPDFTINELASAVFLLIVLGTGCFWVYENFFAPDPAAEEFRQKVEDLQKTLGE